jgi:prohibitin 2
MDSLKGARLPSAPKGGSALVKVAVLGGAGFYAVLNSFYNVEGGHRAIVFNRLEGIKEKVRPPRRVSLGRCRAVAARCV